MGYEGVMDVSYPIRPVDDSEFLAFGAVMDQAFNSTWPLEEIIRLERLVIEAERTLAAFDQDRVAGTTLAYSFGMTVPGGDVVPTAGISGVSVLPTHRRRGILTALVHRQLADIAAGGEPLAALFASESAIYGRYGYGAAVEQYSFTVHRGEGSLRPLPGADAAWPTLRLADPKDAVTELKAVYEAVRPTRPGMLTRSDGFWELHLSDPEFMREGSSPMRCVVAEDESGARGYAMYSAKPDWGSDGMPAGSLALRELFWTDPVACAALWSDLLSRDLVSQVRARLRPADDPLRHMLVDSRRTRAHVTDGLWVRLIDLPAALARRTYAGEIDIVLEVTDEVLPANHGRWRLTAGGQRDDVKAACERTAAEPDVALPVSALGAAYLGGCRLGGLAAAGQITELRPGAVAQLSAAMYSEPAPWSPVMF